MAALAQGPMLRMLSHTWGGGEVTKKGGGGDTQSRRHRDGDDEGTMRGQTSKEKVANWVPDCASLPYTSISSTSSCGADFPPGGGGGGHGVSSPTLCHLNTPPPWGH
mgnify:FL=1